MDAFPQAMAEVLGNKKTGAESARMTNEHDPPTSR